MYLLLKRIMLEEYGKFTGLAEWKKNVLDYVLYLNTLMHRDCIEYPFISRAIAYINTHYTQNINMACVANYVSVNYTYFSEKFREHTGINFNEYLKRRRLEEAKILLTDGYYKVYEVASRSGFGDVKYFTRIFRDETGLSPSEYRRKYSDRNPDVE
jgi:two-component system response regulator YesN